MIQKFSPEIEAVLKKELPATHQLWWVRGVVLSVGEIERATANPEKDNPGGRLRNRVIQVGDLDRPSDGYDLEIEGVTYAIEPNDVVSLLGHEETDADQVSAPRLLINHNTGGLIERAYPRARTLDWGVMPMVERKYWLSTRTPATPAEKLKNLWIVLAVVLSPFILAGLMGGWFAVFLLFGFVFIAAFFVLRQVLISEFLYWIEAQPLFSFETRLPGLLTQNYRAFVNFKRHDLTALYEKTSRLLHSHALKNPAPDVDFVIVDRGSHTNGILSAPAPVVAPKRPLPFLDNKPKNGGISQ